MLSAYMHINFPWLQGCPFAFCKQFITRRQTALPICLLLPSKINGGASQLQLLLLHRAVLSAQVLLEEEDMVIFASLCLPFLTFCSLPFPVQSLAMGGHSAPTHHTASTKSKAHWSFPGATRETCRNKERIPSYSIHWNLPFLLTFPFPSLMNIFLPY